MTSPRTVRTTVAVARSAHLAPGIAVTVLTAALAAANGVTAPIVVSLAIAVLSGQFVVGWTNDLFDADRDRRVGRPDKPLAAGDVGSRTVGVVTAVTATICVIASLGCGLAAGAVHLILGVGSGLAYNAGLKSTVFSPVPYLVAFGSLPVVVMLAADPARLPPLWMIAVAGLLGIGAHLLNVFPDLDDDTVTGVHGLPHRIGRARIPAVSAVLLLGATALCVVFTSTTWLHWAGLGVVVAVLVATVRAPGRRPFYGAIVVAGVDAVLLIVG